MHVDPKALIEGERPMFGASYGKLMMWFFLVSDAFTFSSLLVAYGALRLAAGSEGRIWANPEKVFTHAPVLYEFFHIHAPLVFVGLMTFILIVSSVTMVLAVEAGHRKSKKEVVKWLTWTIIFGFSFVLCQAYEWYHFIHGNDNAGITFAADHHGHGHSHADGKTVYLLTDHTVAIEEAGKLTLANGTVVPEERATATLNGAKNLSHGDDYFLFDADKIASFTITEYFEGGGKLQTLAEGGKLGNGARVRSLQMSKSGVKVIDPASVKYVLSHGNLTHGGANMMANEYGPKAFGNLFFFVTGFHGTHVFSGVVINFIVLLMTLNGAFEKRGHYEMIEKVGLYWHFVDLVWVFVFTLFYLL